MILTSSFVSPAIAAMFTVDADTELLRENQEEARNVEDSEDDTL